LLTNVFDGLLNVNILAHPREFRRDHLTRIPAGSEYQPAKRDKSLATNPATDEGSVIVEVTENTGWTAERLGRKFAMEPRDEKIVSIQHWCVLKYPFGKGE
jgi:hypothetical protein